MSVRAAARAPKSSAWPFSRDRRPTESTVRMLSPMPSSRRSSRPSEGSGGMLPRAEWSTVIRSAGLRSQRAGAKGRQP